MPCITLPVPELPTLPDSFTLTPPKLPDLPTPPGLCCKLPIPPIPIPPIPIPPLVFNSTVIAALNAFIKQAQAYIHSIPLNCPLE